MITTNEQLWNYFSQEMKEYMANRYFKTTRCLLTKEQIDYICTEELKVLHVE